MKKSLLFLLLSVPSLLQAQVSIVDIGKSTSGYSSAFGPRTNLWYDKNLNSIAFIHRSDTAGGLNDGSILYDYSTNGGATWKVNQGPVYDNSSGGAGARYPSGLIYNPPGNTDTANAYVTSYGPTTDGFDWLSHYKGTTKFGSATQIQGEYLFTNSFNTYPPEGFQVVKNTGIIWASSAGVDLSAYEYNDTIVLSKGTFSAGNVAYDFSHKINAPLTYHVAHSIAWNDAGNIGYATLIGNQQDPIVDSIYYLIVYLTTDGGNTWNKIADRSNMNLDDLDPVLASSGYKYTTGYDLDCAVDKNNNLHVAVAIGPMGIDFAMSTAKDSWGIFDVIIDSSGAKWCGHLVVKPETYQGLVPNSSPLMLEDNRQQISRSWDGSKIFVTWFDSDTTIFSGINNFPDMHSAGYDVDNNQWTSEVNFTAGTAAEGSCFLGCVSYYVIENGTDYCIPVVYETSVGASFYSQYHYVQGACLNNFHLPSKAICNVPTIVENDSRNTSIVYPNPNTGEFTVSRKNRDKYDSQFTVNARMEIYNLMGEIIYSEAINSKQQTVNCKLTAGIYFVQVTDGESRFMQKVVVQ